MINWIESRDNPVVLWYTDSWIWRKIKDDRANNKKLLVARSDKRCEKVCKWI